MNHKNITKKTMETPESHHIDTEKNTQTPSPTQNQNMHNNGNDDTIVDFQNHVESLCSNLNKQQNNFLEGLQKFQLETSKSFENLCSIEYNLSRLSQNQSHLTNKIKEFCDKLDDDSVSRKIEGLENKLKTLQETFNSRHFMPDNDEKLKWMLSSATESAAVATASSVLLSTNDMKSIIYLETEIEKLNGKLEWAQIMNWGFVGLFIPIGFYAINKVI